MAGKLPTRTERFPNQSTDRQARKLRKVARTRVLGLLYGFMRVDFQHKWHGQRVRPVALGTQELAEIKQEVGYLVATRCKWSEARVKEILGDLAGMKPYGRQSAVPDAAE